MVLQVHYDISSTSKPFYTKTALENSEIHISEYWTDDRKNGLLPKEGGSYLGARYFKFGVHVSTCIL